MTLEWFGDNAWGLVSGLVAATVAAFIADLIMPRRIKETVGYYWKYVRKHWSMESISISLIMTAKLHAPGQVPVAEFVKRSQQEVRREGKTPYVDADAIEFDVPVGKYARSTLKVRLDVDSDDVAGELMADGIQIRIQHTCTLRNISERLSELQSVSSLVAPIISHLDAELVKERCLECGVKEMAGVGIMLKAMQDTQMRVRVADGRDFELTKDKIRYYTEMFDTDLHTFLKRMIVAYG